MNHKNKNAKRLISSLINSDLAITSRKFSIAKATVRVKIRKEFPLSYKKIIRISMSNGRKKQFLNKYTVNGKTTTVTCCEKKFVIDTFFLEKIKKETWSISNTGYVIRNKDSKLLHKILFDTKNRFIIDHIDRDKLNNKICNIRKTDRSTNNFNKLQKIGKSGAYGVDVNKSGNFYARITRDGKTYRSKTTSCIDTAIEYRNNMEIEVYGFSLRSDT